MKDWISHSRLWPVFLALLGILSGVPSHGAEPGGTPSPADWWTVRRLSDALPWKTSLEDHGFQWNAFLLAYQGGLLDGGRAGGSLRGSGSIDFIARLDFEKMLGAPGLSGLAHLKSTYGENINPAVGGRSQVLDDADFTEWFWIDQLWLRQSFHGGKYAIQAGYLDLQTVLDRNAYANSEDIQFMSQYLDNNNAIILLKVGLGAAFYYQPAPRWDLRMGVSDADNRILNPGWSTLLDGGDSLLGYFQGGREYRLGGLPGATRIGFYHDARSAREWGTTRVQKGHQGIFLSLDQKLYVEPSQPSQGLGGFIRYGWHDGRVQAFDHFYSAGFQYDGLWPDRPVDRTGLAFYSLSPSGRYRTRVRPDARQETGIELYHQFQLFPWMTVTPDVQYILNPGGTGRVDNAITANLRIRLIF